LGRLDDIFEEAFSPVISGKVQIRLRKISKLRRQGLGLIHCVRILLTFQIWFGIAPVSEARWKAKKLDEEDDIEAMTPIQG
jgi:hypothetical protein